MNDPNETELDQADQADQVEEVLELDRVDTGVTCTRKFAWTNQEGRTRNYFPGDKIDDLEAADFAVHQNHGEERGQQSPARGHTLNAPENKAREAAPENKTDDKKAGKKNGKR